MQGALNRIVELSLHPELFPAYRLQQYRTSISCTLSTSSPLVSSLYSKLVLAPWVTSLTILSRVNVLHTFMAMDSLELVL